ncbi:MAG: response regulator [Verrucomicrobia bacterium]|nr:response regulator [Verrucomicrobiota bacterium]
MANEIKILLLEDDLDDALLNELVLKGTGLNFSFQRVQTREAFIEHLEKTSPDLILADHTLPAGFGGFEALEIAQSKRPDVPFIFVTGTLGEEVAIDSLSRGATDYVLKTRLSHLAPAVHRALREAAERAERKRAEQRLQETTEQLGVLTDYLKYVREEEQTRIIRRIQNELGQTLTRLKEDTALMLSRTPPDQGSQREQLAQMSREVEQIAQTIEHAAGGVKTIAPADPSLTSHLVFPAAQLRTASRSAALAGPC